MICIPIKGIVAAFCLLLLAATLQYMALRNGDH